MYMKLLLIVIAASFFSGCASVPMESAEKSTLAKEYKAPSEGNAGLYIYRYGSFGAALKKDVWVDGKCIGETARNVFFYEEVKAGEEHTISTESEFSPNDLKLKTEDGKNYFIKQFIKFGAFVGGAGLELVDEVMGKKNMETLNMAQKGTCSQQTKPSN